MGTSTGYNPPTSGNWPDVKRGVTNLGSSGTADAGTIGGLMKDYVDAQGGHRGAAQQMSVASRAGAKFAGFLSGVRQGGLTQGLIDAGLGHLVGQSASNIVRGLTDYLVGPGSLLEEDIVRGAFFEYLDEMLGKCNYDEMDEIFARLSQQEGIGAVLRQVFGLCIYRRFRTHFSERLMKAADGARTVRRLLKDIKEFILGKLQVRTHGRDLTQINWRGPEGEALSSEILASTWRVFGGG